MSLFSDLAANRRKKAAAREAARPFGIHFVKKDGVPYKHAADSRDQLFEAVALAKQYARNNPASAVVVIERTTGNVVHSSKQSPASPPPAEPAALASAEPDVQQAVQELMAKYGDNAVIQAVAKLIRP